MHIKQFRASGLIIGLLVLMTGFWTVDAQDDSEIPQVTIEATVDGIPFPEEMPEGAVQITFTNNTEGPITLIFLRLNEGVTADDVMAVFMEGGEEAALELVTVTGVVFGEPASPETTLLVLSPGNYMIFVESETGGVGTFTVADGPGEGVAPPPADVEVQLVDFAFNAPLSVAAGPQVWHIENIGEQNHEILVVPLPDDWDAGGFNENLIRALAGEEEIEEEIEAIAAAFVDPGGQTWLTLDLEPGVYGLVCFFPDTAGEGHPHATLGMRQIITVSE
jgi:hypothetical protein